MNPRGPVGKSRDKDVPRRKKKGKALSWSFTEAVIERPSTDTSSAEGRKSGCWRRGKRGMVKEGRPENILRKIQLL